MGAKATKKVRKGSPDDSLSSLPDDCLIEIFSKLGPVDLASIKYANRKMHEIASYQVSSDSKAMARELRIMNKALHYVFNEIDTILQGSENNDYHIFQLYGVCDSESDQRNDLNYVYILESESGLSESVREIKDRYRGIPHPKYRGLVELNRNFPSPCHTIPPLLITQLDRLLQTRSFAKLVLANIEIDSCLLNYLEGKSEDVESIIIHNVRADEECAKRIFSVMMRNNVHTFEWKSRSESAMSAFLDENWIEGMVGDKRWSSEYHLDVSVDWDIATVYRFHLSRHTADLLVHFRVIDLKSLRICTDWVPELLLRRLNSGQKGRWYISITEPLTERHFDKLHNLNLTVGHDMSSILSDTITGAKAILKNDNFSEIYYLHAEFSDINT